MPDIPGNQNTTATINVGESRLNILSPSGDRDWFRIQLDAGEAVQIDLTGRGNDNPLSDPYLRVYDAGGNLVDSNDDGGIGLNSSLLFVPETSGTYYIEAAAYSDLDDGRYTLSVTEADMPDPVDTLLWGTSLNNPTGTTEIAVYFGPAGYSNDGYTSEGFNAYEIGQFMQAFGRIEAVADIEFTRVYNPNNADLRLILDTNEIGDEFLGYFNPPGFGANPGTGVFNGALWDRAPGGDLRLGGFGFVTIMHEVLHGLGLAHPHDNGGGSPVMAGVDSAFEDYGLFDLNQGIFTTMTYNSGYLTGTNGSGPIGQTGGYEAGPMALDIAALQEIYGAAASNTGNNTYQLDNNNSGNTMWRSIWDTSGYDEIVYDGNRDVTIDLRMATLETGPGGGGFVSAANGIAGGFTIANGVRIERAIGDAGDDRIIGNSTNNNLQGRAGNDQVNGNGGDDRMFGGGGNDRMSGGQGDDYVSGSHGRDSLIGGAGEDDLRGNQGRDRLVGGADQDRMTGGSDADIFVFVARGDSLAGTNRDVITDFRRNVDTIDVSAIDADWTARGNQAFEFIGGRQFDDAGQLRLGRDADGNRVLQADQNGDGRADFAVTLNGVTFLSVDDFIL